MGEIVEFKTKKGTHKIQLELDEDTFQLFKAVAQDIEDGDLAKFIRRAATTFISDCMDRDARMKDYVEKRLRPTLQSYPPEEEV